jgi:hypothetical protein
MKPTSEATLKRVAAMSFGTVYPLYLTKIERKGRSQAELDSVITWLTGYPKRSIASHIKKGTNFETFFAQAKLNSARINITGTICGVRVETIKEPLMREVRYLDKLVDELAKGKAMEKILR